MKQLKASTPLRLLTLIGFSTVIALSAEAETLKGEVQSCNDGDTCRVMVKEKGIRVRVSGIDAPEIDQASGKDAKRHLSDLIVGEEVELDCDGKSYKRATCRVFLKGADIGMKMVEAGWAWEAKKYSKGRYSSAMNRAKKNKKGMWAQPVVQSPHCFRHPGFEQCKKNQQFLPIDGTE